MSPERKKQNVVRFVRKGGAAATAVAGAFLALATPAAAQDVDIGQRDRIEDNSGAGLSLRPGAYFPEGANAGLAVDGTVTYGIPVAPLVVAPGARFAAYFGGRGAVTGMPVAEVMLPVGPFVPYVKAGLGIGHASGPSETSVALMAGGGVDVHVNRDVLVGAEASYETVAGTGFSSLAIGPRVGIRY